ncbi:SDR family oxidoreductase [Acetobacter sp. AN02]|uniref:SDR family oxidoreductase n=1 Tax=Acetobacter sp. AN02 TaxID=2894186 RepID=UPI00243457F4|nr:SDR family oxidoreductase [Acetobacter sp. AN02]MDG6094497.1 SDR family oxidoreductase [Acetobacter sp. AN02]
MKKIVVLGAFGFLGRIICGRIISGLSEGHDIDLVMTGRSGQSVISHPRVTSLRGDVTRWTGDDFRQALSGATHIINCIGVLEGTAAQDDAACNALWLETMTRALPESLEGLIHVSALGVPDDDTAPANDLPYFSSRVLAERIVTSACSGRIPFRILRPSFIYAASCYGGSESLRFLAGSAGLIALPDGGSTRFAPVCADDVAEITWRCLTDREAPQGVIEIAGPDVMTTRDIVLMWRRWLGLREGKIISVPWHLSLALGYAGRIFPLWNMSPVMVRLMREDYTARHSPGGVCQTVAGVRLRSMQDFLAAHPAGHPERWHARVGYLRPFLALSVAALWFGSGAAGLMSGREGEKELDGLVPGKGMKCAAVKGFSLMDLMFGSLILSGRRSWSWQFLAVSGYTLLLGIAKPSLWKGLYGPLLKNLPILGLLAVLRQTEGRRG